MKHCPTCKTVKSKEDFTKNRAKYDGLATECRACAKARSDRWKKENPEKCRAWSRAWQKANPEKHSAHSVQYQQRNPEKHKINNQKYRKKYPERAREVVMRRNARKQQATPAWADHDQIRMWYEVAEVLSRSGVQFQVDHIVPLVSDEVQGFHTHDNLQVLPWHLNRSKHNRLQLEGGSDHEQGCGSRGALVFGQLHEVV